MPSRLIRCWWKTDRDKFAVHQIIDFYNQQNIDYWPRWKGDSKELYFHAISFNLDSPANTSSFTGALFSVPVSTRGSEFVPGNPKEFVRNLVNNNPHSGGDHMTYAVSRDGERLLNSACEYRRRRASRHDDGGLFVVVRNWQRGLKK
ncbi:MAG: hypothetical protein HY820_05980 [Acidobacteria bacterium]|nr:hypothetical protein [Acidobacteriota bacterium]